MYQKIRQAIIDKINSESVTKIAQAFRTDSSKIEKYPVALVFPTDQESDYHQTSPESNKETYIFTIRVLYPFTQGQEAADLALEQALDELLTVFRDRNALSASTADWVHPVPSVWGYQDRGTGTMRVAEMKLRVVKYFDPSST